MKAVLLCLPLVVGCGMLSNMEDSEKFSTTYDSCIISKTINCSFDREYTTRIGYYTNGEKFKGPITQPECEGADEYPGKVEFDFLRETSCYLNGSEVEVQFDNEDKILFCEDSEFRIVYDLESDSGTSTLYTLPDEELLVTANCSVEASGNVVNLEGE